jgi:pSer/pThr/pTyr-binding forkhead associated (FHA) protein
VVESIDGHGFDAEIEDLGSTNGLEVNGNRVSAAMIVAGSRIRLGDVEVTLASTATS